MAGHQRTRLGLLGATEVTSAAAHSSCAAHVQGPLNYLTFYGVDSRPTARPPGANQKPVQPEQLGKGALA